MKTTCVKSTQSLTQIDSNCYILLSILPLEMLSILLFLKEFKRLRILLISFSFQFSAI